MTTQWFNRTRTPVDIWHPIATCKIYLALKFIWCCPRRNWRIWRSHELQSFLEIRYFEDHILPLPAQDCWCNWPPGHNNEWEVHPAQREGGWVLGRFGLEVWSINKKLPTKYCYVKYHQLNWETLFIASSLGDKKRAIMTDFAACTKADVTLNNYITRSKTLFW